MAIQFSSDNFESCASIVIVRSTVGPTLKAAIASASRAMASIRSLLRFRRGGNPGTAVTPAYKQPKKCLDEIKAWRVEQQRSFAS